MVLAVTDPKILAELEAMEAAEAAGSAPGTSQPAAPSAEAVTDPAMLEQLEGTMAAQPPAPVASGPASAASIPTAPSVPAPQRIQEQPSSAYVVDKLKNGLAATAAIAAAPVSLVGLATDAVGLTKGGETFGGYAMAKRGWDGILGVKHVAAPTDEKGEVSLADEYLGNIAEFAGGMLIPGAGAVAASQQKLATAIVTALGTVSSGMWATHGKHLGRDLAPSFGLDPAVGEQLGFQLGSLGGTKMIGMVGQAVTKSINASLATADKLDIHGTGAEAQKIAANKLLMREVKESLDLNPTSPENINRAMELMKKVNNFHPNIAQQSNAPGLVSMYNQVANKSPEALAKAAAAEQKNLKAIADYKESVFPAVPSWQVPKVLPANGQLTAPSLTGPAKLKLDTNRQIIQMQTDKANADLNRLSDAFRTRADNGAIGDELRALYWPARKQVSATLDQEIGQVYATAKRYGIQDDMTDIREGVQKVMRADRNMFQDTSLPESFRRILQEFPAAVAGTTKRVATMPVGSNKPIYRLETTPGSAGNSTATFEQVHSLYKRAGKDWADALASGNPDKARYLAAIKDQLKLKIDKYNDPKFGELAEKFRTFNINYSRYSTTFKEGAGGEIAKRGKGGIAVDSEDIVAKVILQSGDKKKGVQDFFRVYGDDVRAAELLHDGMLDNFAKAVMKSGTLNPVAARNWMHQHQAALGELPELQKALGNTTRMGQELVNRRLMLQKQRAMLDRTVLAKIAGREDTEKLVLDAVKSPKLMKGLLVGAITPESQQTIARAIADSVAKQPNSYEFLLKNEAALAPVMEKLGKGHWQNLKDLAELEKIAARTKAPTSVELGKVQDIGMKHLGVSIPTLFSRAKNAATPLGLSPGYIALDLTGRYFYKIRTEELARLRQTAMFDTDTAALLAQLAKKPGQVTHTQLLDLQRISYNAGINSTVQAVGEGQRAREEGKPAFGRPPVPLTATEKIALAQKHGRKALPMPPQKGVTGGW